MVATESRVARAGQAGAYGSTGGSSWLDVDWAAHQRWEKVEGRWVNLIDIGSGPAVFLVHGLCGCWQNWLENICELASDHRVIALDLPGFGHSEMPCQPISIPGYARTLDLLYDVLGIDRAAFVGNSMGGLIGAELAIRRPERVERLCLVAAAGLSVEGIRTKRTRGLRHHCENMVFFTVAKLATLAPRMMLRPRLRQAVLSFIAVHPERLPGPLIAEQVRGAGTEGFQGALDALTSCPIRDRLGGIRCPTLIVAGEKDRIVPVRDASEFARLIPGARKVIYPDTGHLAMIERAAQFNAELRRFLDEAAGEVSVTSSSGH